MCKLSAAEFSIVDTRFVFHCRPLYLRLVFNEPLTEGAGEKATLDIDSGLLVVQLPKKNVSEPFTQLDDPGYLVKTELQRRALGGQAQVRPVQEVKCVDDVGEDHDDTDCASDDELETEFVQQVRNDLADDAAVQTSYGFAGHFRGIFRGIDQDLVRETLQLDADPETTLPDERRRRRIAAEQRDFDEEAMLCSLEDDEGDVAALLSSSLPPYIEAFEAALHEGGVQWIGPSRHVTQPQVETSLLSTGEEEDEDDSAIGICAVHGSAVVWRGNMMEFGSGDGVEFATPPTADVTRTPSDEVPPSAPVVCILAVPSRRLLACPASKPQLTLSLDESTALRSVKHIHHLGSVQRDADILLADLLSAITFEMLSSGGEGTSESIWSVCMLSPSLSWLDTPESVYDACVQFTRRALTYPLHRHLDLVHRTWRDVGILCLLGRTFVVRQLLWLRHLVAHSEHKHVLNVLFVDPLLDFLMTSPVDTVNKKLEELASVLHNIATMTEAVVVNVKRSSDLLIAGNQAVAMNPITVTSVGLPIEVSRH